MKIGYSIEKRGNTYRIIVSSGFDSNGKRGGFSETLPPGTTKQEANK